MVYVKKEIFMTNQSNEAGDYHPNSQQLPTSITLTAVTNGDIIPIESVPDTLFSQKMIGNGFAMMPTSDVVYAPVSGRLVEISDTKHAYYIETKEHIKVLIHIGIDTVLMNGEGFSTSVHRHMYIKEGQELARFDRQIILDKGFKPVIPVIVFDHQAIKSMEVLPAKQAIAGETPALILTIVQ